MIGAQGPEIALIVLTAVILGFLSRWSRQPTVIAYIATGVILGPAILNMAAQNSMTSLFSELGLAFLLFLIGLEINIEEIKGIFSETVAIATAQMALTAMIGFSVATFLGFEVIEASFIALAASFSSTAVVVKLLTDKDEISSLPGKIDVGILLIQDLVVVIVLTAFNTWLGSPAKFIQNLTELAILISVIGGLSMASSRFILPRIFRAISEDQHSFFIHGIGWTFVLITLTEYLGFSMEIGAFIAGISLAQLPYSSELRERIRPLTDLFMAIFFINFGLGLEPGLLGGLWKEALIASAALMIGKFIVIFGLTDQLKFTPETSFKAALNMTQLSEFALILAAVAATKGIIGQEIVGFLSIMVFTTMGASSYLLNFNQKIYELVEDIVKLLETEEKKDVEIKKIKNHAVIIGYDELARKIIPALEKEFEIVVVDRNPRHTRKLSRSSHEYIYGDFKHGEIRKAARIKEAEFVASFSPERWVNKKIIEETTRDTTVFAKAESLEEAAELYEEGAHFVTVKNILAGEKLSQYVKLFLEDEELFFEEVKDDIEAIKWGGKAV